jgi:A118 family predicted phage portal protein
MFQKFLSWIRSVIDRMLEKNTIQTKLNIKLAVSDEMASAITKWAKIYINQAEWLKNDIKSLNLAAQVCTELTRLTLLEYKSEITGSTRADYLNEQYKKFKANLKEKIEIGFAVGGIIFKPFIKDKQIAVDFVPADSFLPVEFDDSGNITSAIFISQLIKGETYYTKLELHRLIGTNYSVTNKAFQSKNSSELGTEILLEKVEEWASLQPLTTIENIDAPLFGYFKVPIANNIDPKSPLGISAFARATNDIKNADEQYGRLMWEYEASEKAIYADVQALQKQPKVNDDGKTVYKMPSVNNRLFKALDVGKEGFFEDYSPEVRDEAFIRGLNKIKQEIEFKCNLAFGTISDPQIVSKTATEIKTSQKRSYDMISSSQGNLELAINSLIYAMDVLATLYNLAPAGKYEASYNWDDSIIVDADAERQQDMKDVAAGFMNHWEYRMKWYGETEEQAKANLPQQADVIE